MKIDLKTGFEDVNRIDLAWPETDFDGHGSERLGSRREVL
jgi:hypothetical protein